MSNCSNNCDNTIGDCDHNCCTPDQEKAKEMLKAAHEPDKQAKSVFLLNEKKEIHYDRCCKTCKHS